MNVDIIILSDAKNEHLQNMTQNTIKSCIDSEKNINFNFFVFEKQKNINYEGKNIKLIEQNLDIFNYNYYMNLGIKESNSDYIGLCNNDLIFTENWCTNIIEKMQKYGVLSASPMCPNVQGKIENSLFKNFSDVSFGYKIREQLSGWLIFIKRDLINVIGKLNEDYNFWCSDNIYSDQLINNGIKHILVRDSKVFHLESKTLQTLENEISYKFTQIDYKNYMNRKK